MIFDRFPFAFQSDLKIPLLEQQQRKDSEKGALQHRFASDKKKLLALGKSSSGRRSLFARQGAGRQPASHSVSITFRGNKAQCRCDSISVKGCPQLERGQELSPTCAHQPGYTSDAKSNIKIDIYIVLEEPEFSRLFPIKI